VVERKKGADSNNGSDFPGPGAPWGGAHGSAADVATSLWEFLDPSGKSLKPETAQLMISNHNPQDIRMRGLGFDLGSGAGQPGMQRKAVGHTAPPTPSVGLTQPRHDLRCANHSVGAGGQPRDMVSDLVAKAFTQTKPMQREPSVCWSHSGLAC
jgi:hypothetical protein